jgi:(p)ppGpp synthase/HD superfamily hydrolase
LTSTISPRLERALRRAAEWHRTQERKGSGVPYFQHLVAVAMILDRHRFSEDVVIAGLLHDAIEDAGTTHEQIACEFGTYVADLVAHCSEVKTDSAGRKRPWKVRKTDHLAALKHAPVDARAIVLADKLHNLLSVQVDLQEDPPIWPTFNASPSEVRWYYETTIKTVGVEDNRLISLARECTDLLNVLIAIHQPAPGN